MRPKRKKIASVLALVPLIGTGEYVRAELDFGLRTGAIWTDNVALQESDPIEQTIALVGLDLDISSSTKRFEGTFDGSFDYQDYLEDVYENNLLYSGSADAEFKLIPETFDWIFEDRFGQLQRNPFGVDVPTNQENINTASTGPNFKFRLSNRTSLLLQGRYRDTWLEISESDSSSLGGTLSILRAMNSNRSLSLNVNSTRVEYDDPAFGSNFDVQTAYVGFESKISRGTVLVDIGVNQLQNNGEIFSGTFVALKLDRELSASSGLTLALAQRYSDVGDFFSYLENPGSGGNLGGGDSVNLVPINDPFELREVSVGYDYGKGGVTVGVGALAGTKEYEAATIFDQDIVSGTVDVAIDIGTSWKVGMAAQYTRVEYTQSVRVDENLDAGMSVERRLTGQFWIYADVMREERKSTENGQNYTANRVTLQIRFNPR